MKIISFLFFSLLITPEVMSQRKKVWSFGPEVGVNYSHYGMDANENDRIPGVCAGLFFTYSVVNTFGITAHVLYSEKGSATDNREEILKYIEVPITSRFFLTKRGRFRPNFLFGPYFGYLRGVSRRTGTRDPVKVTNYRDIYNRYDMGVTGGLGLNFLLAGSTRLLLDGRYSYGLADLTKAPGEINNGTITVTCGLSFGI